MAARYRNRGRSSEGPGLGRIIKVILILVVLGALGLSGYALVSDLPAPTRPVVEDLPLSAG